MGNNILFVNACIRPCSRTEELAQWFLNSLSGDITEVKLYGDNISPIDLNTLEKRNSHDFSDEKFAMAKQFKNADIIVVAAPFWDLSFPSVLKIYFENVTVSGITFEYSEKGIPVGKCNAGKLYYITTSGGYIRENNFGFDYVKALAEKFFGIEDISFFSAEGLDIFGADVNEIMDKAKKLITEKL